MKPAEASPAGAVRERPVPCAACRRATFNHSGYCWPCIDRRNGHDSLDVRERHDGGDAA